MGRKTGSIIVARYCFKSVYSDKPRRTTSKHSFLFVLGFLDAQALLDYPRRDPEHHQTAPIRPITQILKGDCKPDIRAATGPRAALPAQ